LSTGAIKRITHPRYVSRSFLVDKTSGGFRLVVDLRRINKAFAASSVKYETLKVLRTAPHDLAAGISVDISDGYHHIKLHESITQYF
jgi:hypothetical protein